MVDIKTGWAAESALVIVRQSVCQTGAQLPGTTSVAVDKLGFEGAGGLDRVVGEPRPSEIQLVRGNSRAQKFSGSHVDNTGSSSSGC
jgi:hypothetical protein